MRKRGKLVCHATVLFSFPPLLIFLSTPCFSPLFPPCFFLLSLLLLFSSPPLLIFPSTPCFSPSFFPLPFHLIPFASFLFSPFANFPLDPMFLFLFFPLASSSYTFCFFPIFSPFLINVHLSSLILPSSSSSLIQLYFPSLLSMLLMFYQKIPHFSYLFTRF